MVTPLTTTLTRNLPSKAAKNWPRALPAFQPKDNAGTLSNKQRTTHNNELTSNSISNIPPNVDQAHWEPLGSWTSDKIQASRQEHPFQMTWVPGKARHAVPHMTHGSGIYLYDSTGKEYIDWTSQAVCANLGHDIPTSVINAAVRQMQQLPFIYGGIGITEVRVRMNQLMNEILPGTLQAAVFPSSGAEANEAAIMMARRYTGRPKILSFYRSYHGATAHAAAATGDLRRWYGSNHVPGFVKAFSPFPLFFQHGGSSTSSNNKTTTTTQEEQVTAALTMLEEQILNEGPDQIASIMMESVIGAGGCLIFPDGYLQGVRAICDKYGILLHFDEVMVGFGRTGRMFGFQQYPGVLPDIISAAKGISGAAVPLSMTACSSEIMNYFNDKPLGGDPPIRHTQSHWLVDMRLSNSWSKMISWVECNCWRPCLNNALQSYPASICVSNSIEQSVSLVAWTSKHSTAVTQSYSTRWPMKPFSTIKGHTPRMDSWACTDILTFTVPRR